MRCVPRNLQERDEDGKVIGFWPAAFAHRPSENDLSVTWLEYFGGTHASNAASSKTAIQAHFKSGQPQAFGVAQVGSVKAMARANKKPVRVVYLPTQNNPAHSAIIFSHPTPDPGREDLAREFYKEHY